jgi:hypothetical protein
VQPGAGPSRTMRRRTTTVATRWRVPVGSTPRSQPSTPPSHVTRSLPTQPRTVVWSRTRTPAQRQPADWRQRSQRLTGGLAGSGSRNPQADTAQAPSAPRPDRAAVAIPQDRRTRCQSRFRNTPRSRHQRKPSDRTECRNGADSAAVQQLQEHDAAGAGDESGQTRDVQPQAEGSAASAQSPTHAAEDTESVSGAASIAPDQSADSEDDQAMEHWLRRIPDDPGELLRRKFEYENRSRNDESGRSKW